MSPRRTAFALVLLIAGSFSTALAQPVLQTFATAFGQSATATVSKPAGTVSGDLLVVGLMVGKGNQVTITATGWNLILRTNSGSQAGMATYWKWADASEPASYSFPVSNNPKWAIGISRITGAYASNPFDGSDAQTGGSGNVTAPSIDTTVANTLVLAFYTNATAATYTPDGSTSERYDAPNGPGGDPSNMLATFVHASAGATGDKVAAASQSGAWVGQQVGVRPPPPPTAFNAFETSTAAGALTGVVTTKRAGIAFSLDILAVLGGAQYSIFNQNVSVELLANTGVALDANNCPTSFSVLQTLTPFAVSGGRSQITFSAVANAYRDVRVRIRWPTPSPSVTSCSNDNFAIRPDAFASFSFTDNDWQTAGTGRTLNGLTFGAVTHKAGRPFTVRATAVNAAGTPATTTNYTGTPSATLSACAGAACTATFGTLTIGAAAVAGVLTANAATYDNVGSFRVQLVDSTFASVDASDGSTANEREIRSTTLDVGRFVPDHFDVSLNTPALGTACAPGGFTYVGQAFTYTTAPVITVTAKDFSNNTTTLYTGSWWRITNSSLTGKAYSAATGTVNEAGLPTPDPVVAATGGGAGTLTFSSGTGLLFNRTTPVAPFSAEISLGINVIDADNVAYASNPARFGQASAGNGIAFSSGKEMRFGRLVVKGRSGSQLVPLPVSLEAQYAAYTNPPTNTVLGFITNTADSCTSSVNANLAMSNFTGNLAACETAVSAAGTLSGGRRTLLLAAPGSANDGSLLLSLNLGAANSGTTCTTVGGGTVAATGANQAYLQGNWSGASFDQNPSARASFGTFPGAQEMIFVRENF